jgi:Zn-dependent protease
MTGVRGWMSRVDRQQSLFWRLRSRVLLVGRWWNWRVRWGYLEFVPRVHIMGIVVGWFVALGAVLPQSELHVYDMEPLAALPIGVLVYALYAGGRLVHEAGHAVAGLSRGLPLERVEFGAFRAAADWPDGSLAAAPASARRLVAVSGSAAQFALGTALLALAAIFGRTWSPFVWEIVALGGLVNVCGLFNLLPVWRSDGEYLFGWAWRVRPAWLAAVPGTMAMYLLAFGTTAVQFPHGWTAAMMAQLFKSPSGLAVLAVASGLVAWIIDRWVFPNRDTAVGKESRA